MLRQITPEESTLVERHAGKGFKTGLAEMSGWRNNMEDAHLAHIKDDWGFFGVFDGHGGDACSAFVAKRLEEELSANGCPADDAAVKDLVFRLDKEFLDSSKPSGSTATMCIVNKPTQAGGKHQLRVMNIGDSRVLLGRRDGTIVDGGGTDQGLTTDHKPDHPSERERIYRCGGTVETRGDNCARVNGDLSVSRAFGDREYKKTGGPGQEDHPVTSDPEFGKFECDASDFLLLVCDGVSEGSFTNPEVVELAARLLREGNDPGVVARAICFKALETDSKDNISCMVVLFEDGENQTAAMSFTPGNCTHLSEEKYKTAFTAMASRANLTLAQAVEMRYETALASPAESLSESLREEKEKIGRPAGEKGSNDRAQWFQQWVADLPEEAENKRPSLMSSMGRKGDGPAGPGKGKGNLNAPVVLHGLGCKALNGRTGFASPLVNDDGRVRVTLATSKDFKLVRPCNLKRFDPCDAETCPGCALPILLNQIPPCKCM